MRYSSHFMGFGADLEGSSYRAGQVISAHLGLLSLLATTSQAISLLQDPKKTELKAKWQDIFDRTTPYSATYGTMEAELKNLTHTETTSTTQTVGAALAAINIEAKGLNAEIQAALVAQAATSANADKQTKAAEILKSADPLYDKDKLFADTWDSVAAAYKAVEDMMSRLTSSIWSLILIVGGAGLAWWAYGKWFKGKPTSYRHRVYE